MNQQLLINDLALTIALCDACPSTEVDEMTISLLNIFDSRGLGFTLLEALIGHEVDETGISSLNDLVFLLKTDNGQKMRPSYYVETV